jgi:hypothetical protein
MGHAAGDRVLSEIAQRIAACMRDTDTASRVGGDEFVLMCASNDWVADRTRIVDRLRAAIGAPIDIDGRAVRIGVSIGTSAFPADGSDPDRGRRPRDVRQQTRSPGLSRQENRGRAPDPARCKLVRANDDGDRRRRCRHDGQRDRDRAG